MADISIREVAKAYGKTQVVHGIDLDILDREFIVILGPSGCGKSTLLRMIAGLEAISSGEIAIDGKVVNDIEPRARGCAMVFQNYALYPHMTVAQNIGYALKVAGISRAERDQRIATVAATLDISDYLDRKPGQLSGGQRQRVAMGRAMIREPKVFLFDEPLSNLDAKLRVQMRLEIRRLHQRLNATSVFVTHDQVEAMTLADRLVVMNAGHVEQVGNAEELYERPASKYVGGFIGSPHMNFLKGQIADDGCSVVLEAGPTLPINPRIGRAAPGAPVDIGIRPEHARRTSEGANLTVRYDFLEELGNGRLFHGRVGDSDFIVQSADKTPPAFGEEIGLRIDPFHIHLFDGETGVRLQEIASVAPARTRALEPA